jgi:hypothetical protein
MLNKIWIEIWIEARSKVMQYSLIEKDQPTYHEMSLKNFEFYPLQTYYWQHLHF